jgi:MoaA/NifB/PqqE/SkfB family radical SAM enzyme
MSGVRGGLTGCETSGQRLEFCRDLLSGRLSRTEIEAELRTERKGKAITFVINNSCNLACRHCYLQVDKLTAPELTREEREKLMDSALNQDPDLICLSGKEIFLGNRGVEILSFLSAEKKARGSTVRLGAITNGTLIQRHRQVILDAGLDYLDISVDGLELDHDYNRGKGAFAAMRPNLIWAAEHLGRRLFVNMTLQKRNFRKACEAIALFHAMGVQNIGCGFYQPLPYTDSTLRLSEADHNEIFENLRKLEFIHLKTPLIILLDLDIVTIDATLAFMRSEWFSPGALCVDERGEIYNEFILSNGIRLQVRFAPFPLMIFKSVRITPEGNYLAVEDTVNAKLYADRVLANVRDFNFDLSRVHAHARRSPRLGVMLHEYFKRTLPALQDAYANHVWVDCGATERDSLALV